MPESRAGLSAQTFLLPQPQQMQPVQQEQPFNDGVQALEGLQYVQNQTSDYYKKVSALKSFMQSANKNLGIDVRVPDMSRPESIELNQIYQTAMADILAQGNELKQGAGINNMHVNRGDQFTDTYYNQSAARAQQGRDFYSGLDKIVTESNDAVTTPSYNDAELKAKQEKYDQTKAYYESIKEKDPAKAQYADAQIAGLAKPAPRVYRPNNESTAADRRYARQVASAKNLIENTTNMLWGADPTFNENPKLPNSKGNPLLVSTKYAGKKFGNGTIVEWRFDPDLNTTTLMTTDGKMLTPHDVTGQRNDPQGLASTISGLPQELITDAAYEMGVYDDSQSIDSRKVLKDGWEDRIKTNIEKSVTSGNAQKLLQLKDELKSMKKREWFWNDHQVIDIGQFKIKRIDDELVISNLPEAVKKSGKDASTFYKTYTKWGITESGIDDLLKFLSKYGAVSEYIPKTNTNPVQPTVGTNVAPTTTTQSGETDAARILREYRERNK